MVFANVYLKLASHNGLILINLEMQQWALSRALSSVERKLLKDKSEVGIIVDYSRDYNIMNSV